MVLLKGDQAAQDPWIRVADEDPVPDGASALLTYDRWRRDRDRLVLRNAPLGIILHSEQSPLPIADDLPRLGLVALEFPKFTDGRPYSHARLLRQRLGYRGEVRAVGNVLRDQLLFMRRCGFNAFELPDGADVGEWCSAFDEISVFYQPAANGPPSAMDLRWPAESPAETPVSVFGMRGY
ncbi:MAG: DUF934 domain-containing protein [Rhodospirillales bacterium]|jgi:uncharacterized protein (DUF934 family)|nr:DUF934 domain-containing protein [Rhodospirillales bacterium]HJO97999.1 DUF934 domain-containing protein [Rhodospirillales bacterium]